MILFGLKIFPNQPFDFILIILCFPPLQNFAVSPDGNVLAFQGRFGYIYLMSARSKEWIGSLKMNGEVHSLTFNPDGSRLYSHGGKCDASSLSCHPIRKNPLWFGQSLKIFAVILCSLSILLNYSVVITWQFTHTLISYKEGYLCVWMFQTFFFWGFTGL